MTVHIAYLAEEQSGGSPGVRVVEPPMTSHQAQRGSFFAVVDLSGSGADVASLTERLLSAMQRTYYTAKGTQSQVLTETMRSAQVLLQTENAQTKANWRAGIICIGLMNDRLALAGMGDAFAFVTTDGGDVNVYPPERLDTAFRGDDDPYALWPLHRQKIDAGGAILAGSGRWLELISPRTLAGATAYVDSSNCVDAAEGLRDQAGVADLPGLLLVFEWGDGGSTTPPPAAPPPASETSRPERPSSSGLTTAVNASPPVTGAPPDEPQNEAVAPGPGASRTTVSGAAGVMAANAAFSAEVSVTPPSALSAPSQAQASNDEIDREEAGDAPAPSSPSGVQLAAMSATLAAGAKAGLGRAKNLMGSMLPERSSDLESSALGHDEEMAVRTATAAAPALPLSMPRTPADTYVPPAPATGGRARLFVAIAAITLLLVPAVVAGMYWQKGATNRAEAESLLDLAQARLLSAQDALDQTDQTTARSLLTESSNYVLQAEEILGRTPRSGELLEQIKTEQQQVMGITPLYGLMPPLASFAADSEPQRLLVIDQDIYVMDTGRGQVVKYRLDSGGETLTDDGQVVLHEGDTIDGVAVGGLVDIAWQQPIPGYEDKSSLMLLDANNRVFRYNQVDGASLMSFGEGGPWKHVTQLAVFSDRLYMADEGANQIYRYAPGTYMDPPENWFLTGTQVSLQGIKSLRIDGDIWLLFDDGKVVRYHSGEQVPYGLDDSVALPAAPVDMYVSQSASDNALYLADAAEERILYFDKESGKFLGQFQAPEGRPLRGMRAIFIDEARGTLFILTDEALYQQHLPR